MKLISDKSASSCGRELTFYYFALPRPAKHKEICEVKGDTIAIPSGLAIPVGAGIYTCVTEGVYFYEYETSKAASSAKINICRRPIQWSDLFHGQSNALPITLKMAVVLVKQEELDGGGIRVDKSSQFPLAKTPEVFTNAVLVHNLQPLISRGFVVESQKALCQGAYNPFFNSTPDLVIYHTTRCVVERTLTLATLGEEAATNEMETEPDLHFLVTELKKDEQKNDSQLYAEAFNSASQLATKCFREGKLKELSKAVIYCIYTREENECIVGKLSKFVVDFSNSKSEIFEVDEWKPIEVCLSSVLGTL